MEKPRLSTFRGRIKDFIFKLISIKGLFAILSTIVYFVKQDEFTSFVFLFSWLFFIVGREVFKIIELLKHKGE